ncbi:GNAT family N-acetyltransferase [Streptomyces sp. NPDC087425]|uniref:GNAT family N-acetyltransferase n=1 Tax=Streptomyces sp. NPDC087425 TaxID=3365787 RepID=UPI00382B290D
MRTPPAPHVPPGYRGRPPTAADAAALHALLATCEQQSPGGGPTTLDGIAAQLDRLARESGATAVLVHAADGELAAWAWAHGHRAAVDVHPGHRGRGLGASLLAWAEGRARQGGADRLAQTVSDADPAAGALLRATGYAPLVTEWLLEIALDADPEVPEPPTGVTVRPFRAGDAHAAHLLTEDAFDEWQHRRKPYAEWAEHNVERASFAPGASPCAFVGDQLVGVVLSLDVPGGDEGYVERVAVRRDQRDRGIARVLLRSAFRAFYRQGKGSCTLVTHSDTGALPLYERLGMRVRHSSTVYGKPLIEPNEPNAPNEPERTGEDAASGAGVP